MLDLTVRRTGVLLLAATVLAAPLAVAAPASASPTANEVAYVSDVDNDGDYGLVLRDLATRRVTTVLPEQGSVVDDPELSPDGRRIAFSTDRGSTGFDEAIAVVDRTGSGLRRLTDPPVTGTAYAVDIAAAWSHDGTRILFTRITTDVASDRQSSALWTVRVPATATTPLVAATPVPGGAGGYTGDWSPDSSRIVFAAVAAGADEGPLRVVDADGTGTPLVTGVRGLMPAWSPDGTTIAYATVTARDTDPVRAQHVTQIATVPAAGGAQTLLAPTRPSAARTVAEYPAWTPDGEAIVYDLFGYGAGTAYPPGELWAVDRQGRRAGQLTATRGDEAQPHVQGPVPTRVRPGSPSTYTPVTPRRVLDTRSGLGASKVKVGPGGTVRLLVRDAARAVDPVPASATAVILNVTVVGATAPTYVNAFPSGTTAPLASNVNARPGEVVPNLVTVQLGADGVVVLRNNAGAVDLVADLAGYYTPDTAGVGFAAVDPGRVLDTRTGVGAPRSRVGAGRSIDVRVTGALPTTDGRTVTVPTQARAVVLNLTAVTPSLATAVRAYPTPAGTDFPTVSNLNPRAGQTVANLVTVAVGPGGTVRLRNDAGAVDLLADVAGYYAPGAAGRFVPVAPIRFLDTRTGAGAAPIATTAGGFADLKVAGARGVPAGATAAVLNLTGTGVSASTLVRSYPFGATAVPEVSNLNLGAGSTRANLAVVRIGGEGRVRVRNDRGALQLVGDLAGYMVG